MTPEFDVYFRRNTWLYRLDPRVKLAFVAVATALAFLWPRPWPALTVAGACLALLVSAQIPALRVLRFLRGLLPFLVIVFVLTALFAGGPGAILLRLGPVRVTVNAVAQGGLLIARLLALALIFYVWLSTTDQAAMVRGFVALRLPYEWGLILALALRYLPILAGLFGQVSEAQQARGLDLTQQGLWSRLRAYRPVLIAVVIGALRHGERLGWALESRGLGAYGGRRTTYRPLHLRRSDVMALAVLAAALLAAVTLRLS